MPQSKAISFHTRWRATALLVFVGLIAIAGIILENSVAARRAEKNLSSLLHDVVQLQLSGLSNAIEQVAAALKSYQILSVVLFGILVGSVVILLFSLRSAARKTAEIAMTRNRLNAIVATSVDAILVFDQRGRILDYNGAATRIFGYRADQAIGKNLAELILPDVQDRPSVDDLFTGADADSGMCRLSVKDHQNRVFPAEVSWSRSGHDDKIYIAFFRDISDRVRAQKALEAARDQAVAGERAKANLLAVMSHEMRTPLNGVLGTLQLLARTNLRQRQRRFVKLMQSSGQMLLEQVNDVLDLSRLDAGKLTLKPQPFALRTLIDDVVTGLRAQAKARGNKISYKMIGKPPAVVQGDRARISQILVNLIGNAIKFTKDGRIDVRVQNDPMSEVIEFRVADTGIGISEDDQHRIFEDFVTLDPSFHRTVEGTGLGLGIVKRLVDFLGGTITVESAPNKGTEFRVLLPLPAAQSQDPDEDTDTGFDAANLSVLLVEDNEVNRLIAREMLASLGCRITEAENGVQAVDLAREQAFDLVFCDISMPELDGVETCKRIRGQGGPNASTPIIAVTAHALPADEARFKAAGMSDVIVKPLTFKDFERVLATHGIHHDQVAPASPTNDLTNVLGAEKAKDLHARAQQELHDGLKRVALLAKKNRALTEVRALAHKLAGLAAVLGNAPLHHCFTEIEDAACDRSRKTLSGLIAKAESLLSA